MAQKIWLGTTDTSWSTAGNWSPSGAPSATDDVRVVSEAVRGIAGGDQSATALGDFIVEEGFDYGLGSSTTDLKIDPNRFEFAGTGSTASYLDLHTAAITALVRNTPSASEGLRGLYLAGDALTVVSIEKGSVGLASRQLASGSVTTVRLVGEQADVWLGEGLTLTTLDLLKGQARVRCVATNLNVYGGKAWTEEEGAIGSATLEAGYVYFTSTGTITTLTINGGTADFLTSGLARTVTTCKLNPGGRLFYDPGVLTITTRSAPDYPLKITTQAA